MERVYRVVLTSLAESMLEAISDKRIQQSLRDKMRGLSQEPDQQGKPLVGELSGFRSLRAVGQRYRIVYQTDRHKQFVIILAVGIRKEGSRSDIYALAQKLIKLHLSPTRNK